MTMKICPWCHTSFTVERYQSKRKYCSLSCAVDSRIQICGEDECWPWQGTLSKGYGVVGFSPVFGTGAGDAHRIAYELHVGPIPEGFVIRHSCDNPICCNYKSHLITGTKWDNTQDAVIRHRMAHGERHPQARLTEDIVVTCRRLYKEGRSCRSLANQFGCRDSQMVRIITGKRWRRVPGAIAIRDCKGENNYRRKFTTENVLIIRDMPLEIFSQADIARVMNCNPGSIWGIRNRRRWAHLEDLPS
jgi:hypothetical protein